MKVDQTTVPLTIGRPLSNAWVGKGRDACNKAAAYRPTVPKWRRRRLWNAADHSKVYRGENYGDASPYEPAVRP